MRLIMGADEKGFPLKEAVKEALIEDGYEIFDATPEAVFFADAAKAVAGGVSRKEYDRGLVFCGTGMGVSIVANKHKGVYAALCESVYQARRARVVNNTNVLCMGGMIIAGEMGIEMARQWLQAEYLEGMTPEKAARVKEEFEALVSAEKEIMNGER